MQKNVTGQKIHEDKTKPTKVLYFSIIQYNCSNPEIIR